MCQIQMSLVTGPITFVMGMKINSSRHNDFITNKLEDWS